MTNEEFKQAEQSDVEKLHQKTVEILQNRVDGARAVIDKIAEYLNLDDKGLWLYSLNANGTSEIIDKIEKLIASGGDKAKMKKRIDELENENAILRSVITVKQ